MSGPLLYQETRELPCPLSDDELRAKGDALAQTLRDIEAAHEAHAGVRAAQKEELAALLLKQNGLRQNIQERRELRPITIEIRVVDPKKAIVSETRLDTGEIIRERFADDKERQQGLAGL